ncbi:MAG: hypothetical protein L6V93_16005 [Clostridiales bacterium]|nr:MAG: hypothetical protein L6V93_16005 [Clostridiales bacterium]
MRLRRRRKARREENCGRKTTGYARFFQKNILTAEKYLIDFKSWEESTGESMTCTMAVDGENYYLQYETADGKQTFFCARREKVTGFLDDLKSYVVEDADKNEQRQEDFNSEKRFWARRMRCAVRKSATIHMTAKKIHLGKRRGEPLLL